MKTIGLIGGMSWESSAEYYRILNERVREKLGGFHSAQCLMYSVDFAEIEILQRDGRWDEADQMMIEAACRLEWGGAQCVVLCTNTMHKSADAMQGAIHIPMLHIADATAEKIKTLGLHMVGLLGTNFTMEEDFYKGRLADKHGLKVLIPSQPERQIVHRVIYDELCLGQINASSRAQYAQVIGRLVEHGAQGIILGCTEIGLLVHEEDSAVPLFDTTRLHAEAAVDWALG
jgi:aspartate racemase